MAETYVCTRCKKQFGIDNIKYNEKGALVCVNCLSLYTKEKESLDIKGEKENFICGDCRFKMKIRSDSPQTRKCSYCGSTQLLKIKKYKDADDLIEDSMDSRYEL